MKFCIVQGATNMGLANPHSQTQAMPIFLDYLKSVAPKDRVLFCLGEVDCGFVIWYRAEKYETSIIEQFEQSLDNYFALIKTYLNRVPPENIIISSVPLPTIGDHQLVKGEVANKRLGINANQITRTQLTSQYNLELKNFCEFYAIHFLDCEQETIDSKTGVVSTAFLNPNPLDHHLDPAKTAPLIVERLQKLILH